MKVKFSQSIFAFLICFSFYSFAFSQQNVVAVKFDEYDESKGANLKLLREKTKQFARKLRKKSKSARGLIFFYNSLPGADCRPEIKLNETFNVVNKIFKEELNALKENVSVKGGDYKKSLMVEFWIIPKNAEAPKPSLGYIQHPPTCCPMIKMRGDEVIEDRKTPLIFSVELLGENNVIEKPAFLWEVSGGKIIEGQGTTQIKVAADNATEIIAIVEVKIGSVCQDKDLFATRIR